MAEMHTHELTEIDVACGVTLEQVHTLRPKGLFIENGAKFILAGDTAPALALSTARYAFGTDDVTFLGTNSLGQLMYGRTHDL